MSGKERRNPGADDIERVIALVDKFVSPPEHDPWWKPIVLSVAR